jgi:hypothetical protein
MPCEAAALFKQVQEVDAILLESELPSLPVPTNNVCCIELSLTAYLVSCEHGQQKWDMAK